jgi:hypothetical protein
VPNFGQFATILPFFFVLSFKEKKRGRGIRSGGGAPWREEKRELVTCTIETQSIEENPCREEALIGPINPRPTRKLPSH